MFIELLPGGKGSCRFSAPLGAHSPVPLRVSPATPPHRLGLRFHTRLSEDLLRFSKPSAETGTLRQSEYRRVMDWIKLGVDLIVAFLKEMQKHSSVARQPALCQMFFLVLSLKKPSPGLHPEARGVRSNAPQDPSVLWEAPSCSCAFFRAAPFCPRNVNVYTFRAVDPFFRT